MIPQIEAAAKQQRSEALLKLGYRKKYHFLHSLLGQDLKVLVERPLSGDMYIGLSDNYVDVEFACLQNLVGQFVNVKVVNAGQEKVLGVING